MDFLERLFGKQIATDLAGIDEEELWWDEAPGNPAIQWVPPGESITVHMEISGGMVYVGETSGFFGLNPEVINPELPVRRASGDPTPGYYNRYYCSYAALSEEERFAYLCWLGSGRTTPTVQSQFLFLFFYGLEQRILGEHLYQEASPEQTTELIQIRAELVALTERYGKSHPSFLGYANRLLNTVDMIFFEVLNTGTTMAPPPLSAAGHSAPISLHLEIDRLTTERAPVPPEWALVWAWYEPDNRLRTPAHRCTGEYAKLFQIRYQERYGEGLHLKPVKQMLRTDYWPAHPEISPLDLTSTDIHDAFAHAATGVKLIELSDEVTNELQAYSRWLARDDPSRPPLQGIALLPAPLLKDRPELAEMKAWLQAHVTDASGTIINAGEVIPFIVPGDSEKLTNQQAARFTTLLDVAGYGFEPDARWGGPAIRAGDKLVLFRYDDDTVELSADLLPGVTALLHLAMAVMSAGGPVTAQDLDAIRAVVQARLDLEPGEWRRLGAHLRWLTLQDVRLTGLKRRIDQMTDEQRQDVGDILITLAARGQAATPKQVDVITRAFKQLGLDSSSVIGQLHDRMTASRNDELVSVRPARAGDPGEPLPRTAAERLSPVIIERKQQETDDVSALLGTIFDDDNHDAAGTAPATSSEDSVETPPPVEGLDAAHGALLFSLVEQQEWSHADYEALAASHGLMPDGALDTLNEFALDVAGELLLETDDPITINDHVRKELPL